MMAVMIRGSWRCESHLLVGQSQYMTTWLMVIRPIGGERGSEALDENPDSRRALASKTNPLGPRQTNLLAAAPLRWDVPRERVVIVAVVVVVFVVVAVGWI